MRFHIYGQNPSKVVKQIGSPEEWIQSFSDLDLKPNVCDAIESMGISEPTSIQVATIPSILEHKNVICCAETGSGKTVAYLAPIMQMIRQFKELNGQQTNDKFPKGLVIVPSRELAEQVGRVAQHLAAYVGIGVAIMMGGKPKHITHTGKDLVISTIGLVEPLVTNNVYSLKELNHLVIDECDSLFDESFSFDVLDLLSNLNINGNSYESDQESEESVNELNKYPNNGIQLVCVSATLPKDLNNSLGTVVDIKDFEQITSHRLHQVMPHVKQDFIRIHKFKRHLKLLELVKNDVIIGRPVIIFSNRTNSSNWIYHFLNDNGIKCLRLNKDITDEERINQLNMFQDGEADVISCTDLGSRGLDTVRVRHVINFDCPHYVSDYIHRSGRTGRMGAKQDCMVTTLVSFKMDVLMVQRLEQSLRLNKPIDSVNANIKLLVKERLERKHKSLKHKN